MFLFFIDDLLIAKMYSDPEICVEAVAEGWPLVINTITNLTRSADGHGIRHARSDVLFFGIVRIYTQMNCDESRKNRAPVAVSSAGKNGLSGRIKKKRGTDGR